MHLIAFSHPLRSAFVSRKAGCGFELALDFLPAIFIVHYPFSSMLEMFNLTNVKKSIESNLHQMLLASPTTSWVCN